MYWRAQGLLFYKNKPKYSLYFSMSNGYGSDYVTIKEWDTSNIINSPKWQNNLKDGNGGRTGEVVVFVGNIPYFAYTQMSDKEKKKVKMKEKVGSYLLIWVRHFIICRILKKGKNFMQNVMENGLKLHIIFGD